MRTAASERGGRFWTTLLGVLNSRFLALCPLVAFAIGLIGGWLTAPGHHSLEDHSYFSAFFATAAAVIATLFVAYALGARVYLTSVGLATLVLALVGISEVAAVAALSPSLPICLYAPLMGLTIGGGLGALLAALLSAGRVLSEERKTREAGALDELAGDTPGPK